MTVRKFAGAGSARHLGFHPTERLDAHERNGSSFVLFALLSTLYSPRAHVITSIIAQVQNTCELYNIARRMHS